MRSLLVVLAGQNVFRFQAPCHNSYWSPQSRSLAHILFIITMKGPSLAIIMMIAIFKNLGKNSIQFSGWRASLLRTSRAMDCSGLSTSRLLRETACRRWSYNFNRCRSHHLHLHHRLQGLVRHWQDHDQRKTWSCPFLYHEASQEQQSQSSSWHPYQWFCFYHGTPARRHRFGCSGQDQGESRSRGLELNDLFPHLHIIQLLFTY